MEVEVKMKKKNGETEIIKYGPQSKYDKANTVRIGFKLNKKTDEDILNWLDTLDNKQGAIKKLIREHIAATSE